MGTFHSNQYPRETEDYRRARDQLLELEIKLRKQLEEVRRRRRLMYQLMRMMHSR